LSVKQIQTNWLWTCLSQKLEGFWFSQELSWGATSL